MIIVGGGPAGCSTALSLSRFTNKATILVIDDSDPTLFKVSLFEHIDTTLLRFTQVGESLPSEATRVLGYLDSTLPGHLHKSVERNLHLHSSGNTSAWKGPDLHESFAITNAWGPGWHLNRALFDETLRESVRRQLESNKGSKLLHARWKSVERIDSGWSVKVEDIAIGTSHSYRCRWIVDATGRKASVAKKVQLASHREHPNVVR